MVFCSIAEQCMCRKREGGCRNSLQRQNNKNVTINEFIQMQLIEEHHKIGVRHLH